MLFAAQVKAQTVFEPIHSGVYDFLDRMAQKGLIEFHDEIRPVSRVYIAGKLIELKDIVDHVETTNLGLTNDDLRLKNKNRKSVMTINNRQLSISCLR